MTDRATTKRRLERAGFTFYSGWLRKENPQGPKFAAQVEMFRDEVEKITAAPARPRGRPKKET